MTTKRKRKDKTPEEPEAKSVDFATKYRPKDIDSFLGDDNFKAQIKSVLDSPNTIPQCILLFGEYGTGKTSLARMFAEKLGCSEFDLKEVDIADFSGISTAREIRKSANTRPMKGPVKVWVLDECFAEGTKIETPFGDKNIENFSKSDPIFSLYGMDEVTHTFKNKVPLDRIVKLKFKNGSGFFTTKEHPIFTERGETPAIQLNYDDLILSSFSGTLPYKGYLKEVKNEENTKEKVSSVRKSDRTGKGGINKKIQETSDLFQKMCKYFEKLEKGGGQNRRKNLSMVWSKIPSKSIKSKSNLWVRLREQTWCRKKKRTHYKSKTKGAAFQIYKEVPSKKPRIGKETIRKNETGQSIMGFSEHRKSKGNKKNKWNVACMARRAWGKWKDYRTTENPFCGFSMAYGGGYSNTSLSGGKWLHNKLQSRHWESEFEIGNRSRWQGSQKSKKTTEGQKEREQIGRTRLESIEVYQRGNNDESFSSIIGDKERDQGYVTFYDLEVKNHPSYFAEGVAVHNCHRGSQENLDCLLKVTEEPPKHCYFFLCTTNPQKLPNTLKSRCVQYKLDTISEKKIIGRLSDIASQENIDLPKEVSRQIAKDSLGHPRTALKILQKVSLMSSDKMLDAAKQEAEEQEQVITLCRALMGNTSWKNIAEILKKLDADPESSRRAIRGYFATVLLNNNSLGYIVLDSFKQPYYNIDAKNELIRCTYEAWVGLND